MKTSDSISELALALSQAQGEMKNPEKNKTAKIPTKAGSSYEYNYADLPSTFDSVRAVLAEHGLSHFSAPIVITLGEAQVYLLQMRIAHGGSGQWAEAEYPLPYGPDVDDKSMASAMTYGRRYLFAALTGLAADDDLDSAPEHPDAKYEKRMPVAPVKPRVIPNPVQIPAASHPKREELNREIMKLYTPFMKRFPEAKMAEILLKRYAANETRLITVEQLADFARYLEDSLNHEPGTEG